MEKFDQALSILCEQLVTWLCGALMIIMMLWVSAHAFSRYVFGTGGLSGTYAFVGAMVVPFVYLGLAWAWYKRAYVVVDMVQSRLRGKVLWSFQFAFALLTLSFFVAMFYGAFKDTIYSYAVGITVGQIGMQTPKWVWEATIVLGTLLMLTRNILVLIKMARTGEVISAADG